jgi:hypothetical protein
MHWMNHIVEHHAITIELAKTAIVALSPDDVLSNAWITAAKGASTVLCDLSGRLVVRAP